MTLIDRIDHRLTLPEDDETRQLRKRLGFLIMPFAGFFTTLFGIFGLFSSNPPIGRHYVITGLSMFVLAGLLWSFPRWWPAISAVLIIVLGALDPLFGHMATGGYTAGTYEIIWTIIGPIMAVLIAGRRMIILTTAVAIAVFIVAGLLEPIALERAPTVPINERLLTIISNLIVLLFITIGASLYLIRQIERSRRRADDLLLNILPAPITRRLKANPGTIADGFDEATVLFADIVDFTTMSAGADPIAIVNKLNEVFSDFDELARARGLEKIKTIGDAYMVAAGLPDPRPDHAAAVVEFARDMLAAVATHTSWTGQPIRLRVGINTGPVVAGVIGRHKFIYDLWGDAVNVASRMESNGHANRIQVTQSVKDHLTSSANSDHRYAFEPRGPVDIKGKGPMMTWLLVE